MKTVLAVSDNPVVCGLISQALAPNEYEVMFCPGPRGPTYVCIGDRSGRRCPLAESADAVVLDASLVSDQMPQGTPVWRLLLYYRSLGMPVVVLAQPGELGAFEESEAVNVLARPSDPKAIATAIESALGREVFHGLDSRPVRRPQVGR